MDFLVNTDKLFNKMVLYTGIIADILSKGADVEILKKEIVKFMDLSDVVSLRSCQETLKSGERKGEYCANLSEFGEMYCRRHSSLKSDTFKNIKNPPQKVLLGNGKVIEKMSDIDDLARLEKDLKKNKKEINYVDTKKYGCRFTLSYLDYYDSKLNDKRCDREKEEARELGYIYSKIVEDGEINLEELINIIYSRDWKYVNRQTVERGIGVSVINQKDLKKVRGETEKGEKILKDLVKLREVLISKMELQESRKKYSKKIEEEIKVENRIRGLSEEYSKNIIKELEKKTYLNYNKEQEDENKDVFRIKVKENHNEKEIKRYNKNIKVLDPKVWERSIYRNEAEEYAMKSGICNDEPTLNEIMKRKSGRGVTSSIIFPPLDYKETNHRNFYCQDVTENLFKPFFTATCIESMPNFPDYGKNVRDHIYIRLEKMVEDKTYKRYEWQIIYHRLRMFYSKYLNINTFHPEFLECREPMTMMRSARLLKANHEETIYALNLDIEYLDDIKYDLYRLMLIKGKTKSQELIVMIYEKFGMNYLEQMIKEIQIIGKKYGIKNIPENLYWMDPENPPDWIDVKKLRLNKAGVRKQIDEEGIFRGKYDENITVVDEELFNIMDPIQMYNLSKEGKISISPRKYAFLKKKKALHNENRELKIRVIQDNRVIQEKDSFIYMARMGKSNPRIKEPQKKEKVKATIHIPLPNNTKTRDTTHSPVVKIARENITEGYNTSRSLFMNFYKEKVEGGKVIKPRPLVDKLDKDNTIAEEIINGRIKYHIWEERLIELIRNEIEDHKKDYVRTNLEKRNEHIKRRNKDANAHYHNFKDMYSKEPILEEKYHNVKTVLGINYSETEEINRVIGSIIEDVNHILNNMNKNYDPNICLDIFRNYREITNEVFRIFGKRIDGRLIAKYSPRVNGRIEILNDGYIIEEKVEEYKRFEGNFATEEYYNILEEYDNMENKGHCSVVIH